MLIVGEAGRPAVYPPILHSGGIAAEDLSPLVPVLEFVDDLAAVVEVIVLQVIDTVGTHRPARIEGVERLLHRYLAQVAVAVVGESGCRRDPAAKGMLVARLETGGIAIDGAGMKHLEAGTGAEEIG